jgi:hypothetical protein
MTAKPHPHAALMRQYADDAAETETPWERWEWRWSKAPDWRPFSRHPVWAPDYTYRRKPRTININGIEVPEPVQEILTPGTDYFTPCFFYREGFKRMEWSCHQIDHSLLSAGMIHLTAEAAAIHAKALRSFTQTEEAAQ